LICALGVGVALLVVPALAAAETFVVNTTVDTETLPATCGPGGDEPCVTLRHAMQLAEANRGADTITFEGLPAGEVIEIEEGSSLPTIYEQVTIDGYAVDGGPTAAPGVELKAGERSEFSTGLDILHGVGTRVEGLAIGGFEVGIGLGPEETGNPIGTEICGDYIGVALDGETTIPNRVGVRVEGGPEATVIGDGGVCARNVISGNEEDGVYDDGLETTIAGNLLGIGPRGEILPNGSGPGAAAVYEGASAEGAMIGGTDPSGVEANLIWFNDGAGVVVQGSDGEVSIRHDSFLENEDKGIEIVDGDQPAPTITAAASDSAKHLRVEGSVTGGADTGLVELDFYASRNCEAPGEGQTFLGSSEGFPVEEGANPYGVDLFVEVPADERAITATSTRAAGATTEFSECFAYSPYEPPEPEPEKHEETRTQAKSNPLSSTSVINAFVPTNGAKVVVDPQYGKVLIKLPGTKKFVPLEELEEIPVGAVIDATKGKVRLTSIDPDGIEQSADFFGGVFRVKQRDGAGLVVLELLDTNACPATGSRAGTFAIASAAKHARPSGKLWGSGHGSFRTEGNDGSATVRGTIWLVEDRCDGTTFFKTRRGIVSVRDFIEHKTLPLPAGKSYLAGEG
jgi:hypothetical protein